MKLTRIYAAGLIGLLHADIDLSAPINLVAGGNGAGKSTLGDALRLVLTADLGRVSLKKEAASLIHDKAEAAAVEVTTVDGDVYSVGISKAGTIKDSQKGREHDARLPYVLSAQRFASLPPDERRAFLFGLMNVAMDPASVVSRLLAKGLDEPRVLKMKTILRAGFDSAQSDAAERAAQARGQWKAVTGENYGAKKAGTWSAAFVDYSPLDHERARTALTSAQQRLTAAQAVATEQRQLQRQHADAVAGLAQARESAAKLQRAQAKLDHDTRELATWQATLQETEAAAGEAPRVGLLHDMASLVHLAFSGDCDDFNAADVDRANVALNAYEAQHGAINPAAGGDADARDRLPGIRSTVQLMQSAVNNSTRDRDTAQQAAGRVEELAKVAGTAFDTTALDAAEQEAKAATADVAKHTADMAQHDKALAARNAGAGATAKAAAHHEDVKAWEAIADALSPAGIRADMLIEAMQPLNDRLAQSAADLGWPQVTVQSDMRITANLRPYGLLSESEQWRCDAMLAEAIANLSGLKLLILDRMDVLESEARGKLLSWLDMLAGLGEVDTVLVMATLKALPAGLPDTIAGHWVQDGHCGVPLAQAA